jgi:outer membrane immunogenic protein
MQGDEIMQRWLLGTAVALAMAAPAIAADLRPVAPPVKAPPVAPIVYNWTGCYVDGGGGYGLFNQDSFTTDKGGGSTSKVTNGGRGWFGTAGGGCDVQFGRWVVGAFGNYDFADLKGDVVIPGTTLVGREKQDSAWAVGGRLGYTLTPTILTYVAGGYTQARFDGTNFVRQSNGAPLDNTQIGAATYSGWFVGSGFEYSLGWMPGLFWKTEYRFAQYDRESLAILNGAGAPTGGSVESDKTIQTIRSELVWRFNWGNRY